MDKALASKFEGCRLQVPGSNPRMDTKIITGEICRFIKTDLLSMTKTNSGEEIHCAINNN